MSKQQQEFLAALVAIVITIGIVVYFIKQVQEFTDANDWMHTVFALIWIGVTFWMGFLTHNDMKNGNLRWSYGWINLWKPIVGIITFVWAIQQSWKALLAYPWLIFIPLGIIVLIVIIKYIIRFFINRNGDTHNVKQ